MKLLLKIKKVNFNLKWIKNNLLDEQKNQFGWKVYINQFGWKLEKKIVSVWLLCEKGLLKNCKNFILS